MQYLLTEEEHQKLKDKRTVESENAKKQLGKLVELYLDDTGIPCVARPNGEYHYCDDCPLESFCDKHKDYSQ